MPYVPLSTSPTAAPPAPAPVATEGKGYVSLSSSGASAPATTAAPTPAASSGGGYQPISKVGLLPSTAVPATVPAPASAKVSTQPGNPNNEMNGSLGGGYGASSIKDPYSGKPLLTYENQAAKSSQLYSDRVAPTFDPTIPQKIDPSILHNGRMPESASEAVRQATGAEPDEQLDHLISLELGGSNDTSNLNLEKTQGGVQPSLTLENATAKLVANGTISYIDGQKAIARAKGVKLPDDTGYDTSAHPLASAYPKPNNGSASPAAPTPPAASPMRSIDTSQPALPFTPPSNASSTTAAAPNPSPSTPGLKGALETAITNFAPFKQLALMAGGKSFIQSLQSTLNGQTLNSADIDKATARVKQLIAQGVPNTQAAKQALTEARDQKMKAFAQASVGPNEDLIAEDVLKSLAEETDPAAVKTILTSKGVDPDSAHALAPLIAVSKDPEQIKAILQFAAEKGYLYPAEEAGKSAADKFAAQEAAQQNKTVPQLYEDFDKQRLKLSGPGTQSADMKDVAQTYPFTDEAKNTVLENTNQINKHIPGEYASFNTSKTGKDKINISEPDPTNTFHEMVHSWIANSDHKPDLNAFQSAFDQAKATNPVLQNIDQILSKDTHNYPAANAKDLPEERFAYVAEAYGAHGLSAIPQNLRPFYSDLLTDHPAVESPVTGKPNPGLTPVQSQSLLKSTNEGAAKATAAKEAEEARVASVNSPVEKNSWLQSLRNKLKPLAGQDAETKEAFADYTKKLTVGHDLANQEAKKLTNIPAPEAFDAIHRYERGSASPYTEQLKNEFEGLYDEARKRGLDVPHRKNYIPHAYAESPEEIKAVVRKYLESKGVSKEQIEAFMNGTQQLPESTAKLLGINPSFTKERMFTTYQDAIDASLHPKYTHPAQLAGMYRESMERAIANRQLVADLVSKGKLVTSDEAPRGYQPVNLEFSRAGYYAKPRLAAMLNGLFQDTNAQSFGQKFFGVTGAISRGVQKVGLLTGIPGTDINLHGISLLIEQITAGNLKAIPAFLRANNDAASVKFFEANRDILQHMAQQGIDLGHTVADYPDMYKNLMKPGVSSAYAHGGTGSAASFIQKEVGGTFDHLFSKKDFSSFMPQIMVQTFKDAAERFTAAGLPKADADAMSADVVRAFHGLIGNVGRARATEDALSTAFYAPRFRESIINTLWNSAKSATTEFNNPAFYRNRRLLAGLTFAYGLYVAANKFLSGHYMWQNSSGHQFDLQIPTGNGNFIYIPFMPSFLAVPRNVAGGALSMAQGDLKGATQQFTSILSAPLQLFGELYANKDFYGNAIYADTDPGTVKAQKIASYLGLNTVPPFIKAAVGYIQNKSTMPLYQAITAGLNLPIKYGTQAKNNTSDFYTALTNSQNSHAQALATFRPTFDKIQQLIQSGQKDQAQQMVDSLSDSDYAMYKGLKTASTRTADTKADTQFMPTYRQIQSLVQQGNTAAAQKILNGLSDTDYKTYQRMKTKNL